MIVEISETNPSKQYVEMISRFLGPQPGYTKRSDPRLRYWKKFERRAWYHTVKDLDIRRSREVRFRHHLQDRQCYYNAAMVALTDPYGLDYVEGIATSIIPVEHAWLVDKNWGKVIDPTWVGIHERARKPEHKIKDYYGVRIPTEIIRRLVTEQEIAGPMLWQCMDEL